jgi:hypothetical protein
MQKEKGRKRFFPGRMLAERYRLLAGKDKPSRCSTLPENPLNTCGNSDNPSPGRGDPSGTDLKGTILLRSEWGWRV